MRNNRRNLPSRTHGFRLSPRARKITIITLCAVVGLFIITNIILWISFNNRTYPQTRIMQTSIGSVQYNDLAKKISTLRLIPEQLELIAGNQKMVVSPQDLGIRQDISRTTRSAKRQRHWLPIINLFTSTELQAPVAIDKKIFDTKTIELAKVLRQDSTNATLQIADPTITITPAKDGFELDQQAMHNTITSYFDTSEEPGRILVKTTVTKPAVNAESLLPVKADIEAQLRTAVTITFNGKNKQVATTDIAAWYVQINNTYELSLEKIQAYITQVGTSFGIRVKDLGQAAETVKRSLAQKQDVALALTAQPTTLKTFTYCVAAKGVAASFLPTLKSKLQETYGSSRGWSADNVIAFNEVASGCDFTVWLSAPELMPTFGAICDSTWSCRVGRNVVINFDRWQNASPAWNSNGGSLSDYRHMVINHETGHWLGFGHANCSGPGQLAPVMQQQSINLQGCAFNPWPTTPEVVALKRDLGI